MINIIENYASALFSIYLDSEKINFSSEIKLLKSIFKKEVKLIKLLSSTMLLKAERNAVIDIIFRNKFNKLLVNFLHVLVDNNQFLKILSIIKLTLKKIDEEQGVCFAIIESPFVLTKEEVDKIKKAIEKRKQSFVEVDVLINKKLIGGLKIIIGNEIIDNSIKTKIQKIKQSIKT